MSRWRNFTGSVLEMSNSAKKTSESHAETPRRKGIAKKILGAFPLCCLCGSVAWREILFFFLVSLVLTAACPLFSQTVISDDFHSRLLPAPRNGGFTQDDYWVWGSSVIKGEDNRYHMFVSRWLKYLPFHPGWMIASEIAHAVADRPQGPYHFSDVALPARGAQYWDGRSTHNPKILKSGDLYVLYYMGSTHPFADLKAGDGLTLDSPYAIVARSNKRIGIATSKSPYGPWQRRDAPILDTRPNTFYSFLTSNPSPWINEDGSVILLFKSRAYKDSFPFQTSMKIGVATAPHFAGPYTVAVDHPIFGEEQFGEIEDPTIWKDAAGYHLLAKDQQGSITGMKHSGIHAISKDGIHWELASKPLAYTKSVRWDDGSEQTMGQLERVFVFLQDGVATHLFFATMDGPGGFQNGTKSWNMVIPLKAP